MKIIAQEVDIDLAQKVLNLVNAEPPRYTELDGGLALFVEAISASCASAGGDRYFARDIPGAGPNKNRKTVISLNDQSGHEVNRVPRGVITDLTRDAILFAGDAAPLETRVSRLNDDICSSGFFQQDDFLTTVNGALLSKVIES